MKNEGNEVGTVVTFDHGGVSWHPNHIAVHMGCKRIYKKGEYSFDMYMLETCHMMRKYISFFDIFMTNPEQQNYY